MVGWALRMTMGWLRKFFNSPKPPPEPVLKPNQMTEALIVSMVMEGYTYAQLREFFDDMPEEQLKKVIKRACDGLGLFPEGIL